MDWKLYPYLGSPTGSRIGLHSQGESGSVVISQLKRRSVQNVTPFAVVKSLDAGKLAEFAKESPDSIRILRVQLGHPDDPMNDVLQPDYDIDALARRAVEKVARGIAQQGDVAHFYEVYNEMNCEDPALPPQAPGLPHRDYPDGWRKFALVMKATAEEATRRGIHLAIGGLANGTPGYLEMQAMVQTGLFGALHAGQHAFSVHEGVWGDEPIDQGWWEVLPGAPGWVANGGCQCGRVFYLLSLLRPEQDVPIIVSEFYPGGKDNKWNLEQQAERLAWYDKLIRKDPRILGFCPYTIDPPKDSGDLDCGPLYSDALFRYMAEQRPVSNPIQRDVSNPPPVIEQPTPEVEEATMTDLHLTMLNVNDEESKLMADVLTSVSVHIKAHKPVTDYRWPEAQPAPKHALAKLTNQAVFNLFLAEFGMANYWEVLKQTGMDTDAMLNGRYIAYTGPAVEDWQGDPSIKERFLSRLPK